MKPPTIQGIIDRRMLINYRVDPEVLRRVLPEPFRPQIENGYAIAGICLIRLRDERPMFWPRVLGFNSENAAHRIAVEWDEAGETYRGVYIPRRDTNSCFAVSVGGRWFPGIHHFAKFDVNESHDSIQLEMQSRDENMRVMIHARFASSLPTTSVFGTLDRASAFFEAGSVGYSATKHRERFDGLRLDCPQWRVEALEMLEAESSFFDDRAKFPAGSVTLDCGLIMRNIAHRWHALETMCCKAAR